jgi:hypothetical protein
MSITVVCDETLCTVLELYRSEDETSVFVPDVSKQLSDHTLSHLRRQ